MTCSIQGIKIRPTDIALGLLLATLSLMTIGCQNDPADQKGRALDDPIHGPVFCRLLRTAWYNESDQPCEEFLVFHDAICLHTRWWPPNSSAQYLEMKEYRLPTPLMESLERDVRESGGFPLVEGIPTFEFGLDPRPSSPLTPASVDQFMNFLKDARSPIAQ